VEENERIDPKEIFLKEVDLGLLRVEITIIEKTGYRVILTATDSDNRRIWKTALTHENGHPKIYACVSDAISDAEKIIAKSLNKQILPLSVQ
jgi:hypothetical protein